MRSKQNIKSRKAFTGIHLYNRIYQELNNYTEFLPPNKKVLTTKQKRNLASKISAELSEQYSASKRTVKLIQDKIFTQYPTQKRKPAKSLYYRLLNTTKQYNNNLSSDQQLTLQKRKQIVSSVLYPEFKAKSKKQQNDKNFLKRVTEEFNKAHDEILSSPLAIPQEYLAGINFFELDETIKPLIPDCIDIRVHAGRFGNASFNSKDYSYYGSGVKEIVEKIRKAVENKYDDAVFYGYKKLKEGYENDLTPDNYYIDFILNYNGTDSAPVDDAIFPTRKQLPVKEENKNRKTLNERLKKLHIENKSKRSAKRKTKITTQKVFEKLKKQESLQRQKARAAAKKAESEKKKAVKLNKSLQKTKKEKNEAIRIALAALKQAFDTGAIKLKEYNQLTKKLKGLKNK